ncbi:alpha/beta hydrolase-fold protein [Actinoplanes sp. NEAU-A12]|uniref:Alpha/beta hydrolase-fold protein n=1 Tax=Actinoplanes sandaracinus TaxID=3045177 RepID=A0ABT6WQV9_9ACTN|nr:alpha/beta hydrolase-fold protein [Actinoplanes sandaracinus]MDI6102088.1 alpha/beta hydrolase-fold protein [Actinoplanes sandaracinus]
MSLDGTPLLIAVLVAVPVTAVLIAAGWDRRGRWRWALRLFSVLTALLSVTAAVLVQLNRMTEVYSTDTEAQTETKPASDAVNAPATSQLLTLTVAGPASGLTMTMYAYLPAAYRTGDQRFPVIQALHGYPGSPSAWIKKMQVQSQLDTEIAAGRMAPTVVLFPSQTPDQLLDTECTNLRNGPQTETFLTVDVPAYAKEHLRIRDDTRWGLIGFSAGGYCASSLALRHPTQYAAAASLSGLAGPGIVVGDGEEDTTHNVAWRLQNLPSPPVALWMGWGADEKNARRDSLLVARVARPPVTVTTAVVPQGGHSYAVWRQMEGPAFDWLSAHLARPMP